MASKVTVGTDPEALLFDQSVNKFVPACGLIGGTKRKPLHFNKSLNKGFTIQEDNVMVEFNIPPAHNLDQWCDYIQTAIVAVRNYVASKGPYEIKFVSAHKFPKNQMRHEQAMHFGCSPDFDAYADGGQFKSVDPESLDGKGGAWRFAGGHIHLGYTAEIPAFVAAAFADFYIGLAGVGLDSQERRRKYYGQPGRYRPTSYGLEYRSPSNYWLQDSAYVMQIGSAAFQLGWYLQNTSITRIRNAYQKIPWGAVRTAISTQDQQLCNQVTNYIQEESLLAEQVL